MSFTQIRERDANGALVKSGFTWLERRDSLFLPALLIMVFAVLGAVVGLIILSSHQPADGALLLTICVTAFIATFWGMRRFGAFERSFYFEADGSMVAPVGLPDIQDLRRGTMHQSEIASIEARPDPSLHGVILISRDGYEHRLGHKMLGEHARLVAIQLNIALVEMRTAIGGAQKVMSHTTIIE